MNPKIVDFLTNHRICSLTTLLKDGSPHASALHYSYSDNPFELYFSTENTSKKCEALLDGNSVKASVVIGFSEEEWQTVQMDGEVRGVVNPIELKVIQSVHYAKHPNSEKYKDDPATMFLKFMPGWWRYTDYNTVPPMIMGSDK